MLLSRPRVASSKACSRLPSWTGSAAASRISRTESSAAISHSKSCTAGSSDRFSTLASASFRSSGSWPLRTRKRANLSSSDVLKNSCLASRVGDGSATPESSVCKRAVACLRLRSSVSEPASSSSVFKSTSRIRAAERTSGCGSVRAISTSSSSCGSRCSRCSRRTSGSGL